jgi:small subunit ribosomal protein S8
MNVTDPIADTLTRIRNAGVAHHSQVAMPHSKMREALAGILKDEGFVSDFEMLPGKVTDTLVIHLKYTRERHPKPVIAGLNRVSKPGRRVYCGKRDIPWVRSGLGVAILSTPKGVMTGRQARNEGVGGEVLCYVW